MYKVIRYFTDLQDNNRPYNVGDPFPHIDCGYPVTKKRIAELSTENNLQKAALIRCIDEDATQEAPKKKRAKKTAEQ